VLVGVKDRSRRGEDSLADRRGRQGPAPARSPRHGVAARTAPSWPRIRAVAPQTWSPSIR
jgi:hypothetical protein